MLQQQSVPTLTSTSSSSSFSFRSLLPHEPIQIQPQPPLPIIIDNNNNNNNNGKEVHDEKKESGGGYLIVQGSFTPKITITKQTTTKTVGSDDATTCLNEEDNDDSNNIDHFWMDRDMLVQHIMLQITNKDQFILSTQHIPIQIQVLTPQPPYTKIQFTFQTEQIMMETVRLWKYYIQLTPFILFDENNHTTATNTNTTSTTNSHVQFSKRSFQFTPLRKVSSSIQQPSSNDTTATECCWNRSNPPKFYRIMNSSSSSSSVTQATLTTTIPEKTRIVSERSNDIPNTTAIMTEQPTNHHNSASLFMMERATTRFLYLETMLQNDFVLMEATPVYSCHKGKTDTMNQTLEIPNDMIVQCLQTDQYALHEAIRSILAPFDTSKQGIEIFTHSQKGQLIIQNVHVGMRNQQDLQIVLSNLLLQNQMVQYQFTMFIDNLQQSILQQQQPIVNPTMNRYTLVKIVLQCTKPIFVDYASITHPNISSTINSTDRNGGNHVGTTTGSTGEVTRSECTSCTCDIQIPGLQVIENYITHEEELLLMAVLTGPHAPWAPKQPTQSNPNANVKRQVQHYGYVFDYQTNHLLYNSNNNNENDNDDDDDGNPSCPPLPSLPDDYCNRSSNITENHTNPSSSSTTSTTSSIEPRVHPLSSYADTCVKEGRGWELLACKIEQLRQYAGDLHHCEMDADRMTKSSTTIATQPPTPNYTTINQMTINQYKPGQGIGSHVETIPAFADGLLSLSLNSGIVMEFRKVVVDVDDDATLSNNSTTNLPPPTTNRDNNNEDPSIVKPTTTTTKKLVYLPPRSLLLLSGEARYLWEHGIVTRMTDTHNGQVLPRKLRVSLTLRTGLDQNGDILPLRQSNQFPPAWRRRLRKKQFEQHEDLIRTPACERDHVHAVYDAIAQQWNHTRGRRGVLWPGATQFLQNIPIGSVVADVGCGDGKYFPAIWEAGSYVIGTDISEPLLRTAVECLDDDNHCKNDDDCDITDTNHVAEEDQTDNKERANSSSSDKPSTIPDTRRVSRHRKYLKDHPAVAVADCLQLPLRTSSCDAAICIAVMHHLSTDRRRKRCLEELVRIVKPSGLINVQAWALEQNDGSKRKFVATDVYVPFNAQPKYLQLQPKKDTTTKNNETLDTTSKNGTTADVKKSIAQMYSETYKDVEYDDKKGLVVFKRYCHLYRRGELDEIANEIPGVSIIESGFENGNYFIIMKVHDTK